MKYILFLFLLLTTAKYSVSQTDSDDIFSAVAKINTILNRDKPTLFYTAVSWCSANLEDIFLLGDTIREIRSKINLVILLDSNMLKRPKYYEAIKSMYPDSAIILNKYFPTCFYEKKEAKLFAKQANRIFNTKIKMIGPSALFTVTGDSIHFFSIPFLSTIIW